MKCRAIPYEGQEPYVFLSYCHKDADRVYPLLEQLVRDGYRVWYDDGNHPGDDWLENIAQHLNGCRVCLAMVSENSGASHNCRNEINLAIECNKKLMAVLIEDFVMPLGMRLQLGTVHYLKRQDYPSDSLLLRKLCETEELQACRGEPGKLPRRKTVKEPEVREETPKKPETAAAAGKGTGIRMKIVPLDTEESDPKPESEPKSRKEKREEKKAEKKEEVSRREAAKSVSDMADEEKTVIANNRQEDEEDERTMRAEQYAAMLLLHLSASRGYVLTSPQTQIGRSKRCDVVLAGNPYIGSHHADIIQYKGHCYLRDLGSVNGSFIGEEQIEAEGQARLENRTAFRLYDEAFLFFCGPEAQKLAGEKQVYFIRNPKTRGIKILYQETLPLDRSHKWEDGTMGDAEISRGDHAAVVQWKDGLYLKDKGHRNGVYLCGRKLSPNETCRLKSGDEIRIGQTLLEVGIVTLKGEN